MSAMASQITNVTIAYSNVYSGADQRKHQSSASPAFVNSPVTRKMFPFDDIIMFTLVTITLVHTNVRIFFKSDLLSDVERHSGSWWEIRFMDEARPTLRAGVYIHDLFLHALSRMYHHIELYDSILHLLGCRLVPHLKMILRNFTSWYHISLVVLSGTKPTEIYQTSIWSRAWISDYLHEKQWDVITHSWSNFNSSLVNTMVWHAWVITSHIKQLVWLLMQTLFSLQWRHNGRDSVSNKHRSKKTSKLRVTGLLRGNHRR